MTDSEEDLPYRVEQESDGFKVVDPQGKEIIASSSSTNVEQYAALLNQSCRRGYKAGFHNAKLLK